jgi:hypothetical protein
VSFKGLKHEDDGLTISRYSIESKSIESDDQTSFFYTDD